MFNDMSWKVIVQISKQLFFWWLFLDYFYAFENLHKSICRFTSEVILGFYKKWFKK